MAGLPPSPGRSATIVGMGRKGPDQQQIDTILRKSEEGAPIAELCREYGISVRTFYRWKAERTRPNPDTGTLIREIESENQQLKSVLAELVLENRMLKEQLGRTRKQSVIG
jgi:putative transposase